MLRVGSDDRDHTTRVTVDGPQPAADGLRAHCRELTYVGGTSRKFWRVFTVGSGHPLADGAVVTQWGRLGTDGQTKTIRVGSRDEALTYVYGKVDEKIRKGYVASWSGTVRLPGLVALLLDPDRRDGRQNIAADVLSEAVEAARPSG